MGPTFLWNNSLLCHFLWSLTVSHCGTAQAFQGLFCILLRTGIELTQACADHCLCRSHFSRADIPLHSLLRQGCGNLGDYSPLQGYMLWLNKDTNIRHGRVLLTRRRRLTVFSADYCSLTRTMATGERGPPFWANITLLYRTDCGVNLGSGPHVNIVL